MGKVTLRAIFCGIAGVLAWVLCEPFFPKQVIAGSWNRDPVFLKVELTFTFLLGTLIGLTAGFLNGTDRGGRTNVIVSSALGLIFGAVGAMFGQAIGSSVYAILGGGSNTPANVIARTLALLPFGLLIGAAVGVSQRSVRSMVSGAIGGAVAGFLTGAAFDTLSQVISRVVSPVNMTVTPGYESEAGAPGRAVMAMGMGLLIGLFTALADLASRKAWVRLVLGRNEGKEWPIDAGQTLIGRDERAHVPLFSDPSIPPLAAVIVKQGNTYHLQDPQSPIGVGLNGHRVSQAQLNHGDTINIGPLSLQFLVRSGGSATFEGRHKGVPIGPAAQPQQQRPTQVSSPSTQYPTAAMIPQPQAQSQTVTSAQTGLCLVALTGPMAGNRFAIGTHLEIGREGSGLSIAYDPQASRRHAAVALVGGQLTVSDLGSTNGTYVNGHRVTHAAINTGDQLMVGSTTFRVE